jgi:predicted neuraminidase
MAESADDGKQWSACVPTSLPNNNAGIQAYSLASGRIAMVYNPTNNNRNVLSISLSEDGGKTWPRTRILEQDSATSAEFSYPTLKQSSDGKIHISYTFKRECIKYSVVDEAWIMK